MITDDPLARDLTGYVVTMPDLSGRVWFEAIADERIAEDVYRFTVIQLGGRYIDAEIIANVREMEAAAVAPVTGPARRRARREPEKGR
jgi:hypothetical protein